MAHYTTLVRTICEQAAGCDEPASFDQIDDILTKSWRSIFTTSASFDESVSKEDVCKAILKHYYMSEIGAETAGLWKLWMNTRLEELLPYYNPLWHSAALSFEPFLDVDYTETTTGQSDARLTVTEKDTSNTIATGEDNTDTTGSTSDNATTAGSGTQSINVSGTDTTDSTGTSYDLFSDTPQGALSGVDTETYLTDARKKTDATESTVATSSAQTTQSKDTGTQTSESKSMSATTVKHSDMSDFTKNRSSDSADVKATEGTRSVKGKMGTASYSDLLLNYRKTIINITEQLINDFHDLFMWVF